MRFSFQARTILKYDQTLDRFAPITLQYMLQHSMRFAPDGSLHPAHWTLAQQGDHFFAQVRMIIIMKNNRIHLVNGSSTRPMIPRTVSRPCRRT